MLYILKHVHPKTTKAAREPKPARGNSGPSLRHVGTRGLSGDANTRVTQGEFRENGTPKS